MITFGQLEVKYVFYNNLFEFLAHETTRAGVGKMIGEAIVQPEVQVENVVEALEMCHVAERDGHGGRPNGRVDELAQHVAVDGLVARVGARQLDETRARERVAFGIERRRGERVLGLELDRYVID